MSNQEEADTKVFLAVRFSFELGFVKVSIITIDTDVAVLTIYYQSISDGSIYLEYETSTKTQKYNISLVIHWTNHWSNLYLASML